MRALVTGITGFVGSELAPRLLRDGHEVVGLTRNRSAAGPAGAHLVVGDAAAGAGLAAALEGVEVAYYLNHSFEAGNDEGFASRDRRAAENFARAAEEAGVARIVYLGINHPDTEHLSAHLESRFEVEDILCSGQVPVASVRANFLVSARNPQFWHLVRVLQAMPVIALAAWRSAQMAPLDSRDVVAALVAAASVELRTSRAFDLGGRERLTFGELLVRLAAAIGLERDTVEIDIAAHDMDITAMAGVSGIDPALLGPLLETAQLDLVPGRDDTKLLGIADRFDLDTSLHDAVRALEHLDAAPEAAAS